MLLYTNCFGIIMFSTCLYIFHQTNQAKKVVSYRSVTVAAFLSCSCEGKMRYIFILGEKGSELEGKNGMKVQSLGYK